MLYVPPIFSGSSIAGLYPKRIHRFLADVRQHALGFRVEAHRLHAEFAAVSRLLVATERNARKDRVRRVDRDGAAANRARDAIRAAESATKRSPQARTRYAFASAIASASSVNRTNVATGPKISSRAMRCEFWASKAVGLQNVPSANARRSNVGGSPPKSSFRTFCNADLTVSLDLVVLFAHRDRADVRRGIFGIADAQLLRLLGKARDESLVDPRLQQDARTRFARIGRHCSRRRRALRQPPRRRRRRRRRPRAICRRVRA